MVLKLNDPRALYGFETYRHQKTGGDWLGCNHCGRTVPDNPDRVEAAGSLYHRYCYLYVFRRDFAELIYGRDVFKNSPWEAKAPNRLGLTDAWPPGFRLAFDFFRHAARPAGRAYMNGALSTHQWPTKAIADPPFSPIGDVRYWRMRTFHRGKPRSRMTQTGRGTRPAASR
jgi:hypothetical protein